MEDDTPQLNADTFYGLPQEMYDLGYRIDFNSMKTATNLNGDITVTYGILCPDGTPWGIKGGVRTEGRLIQQISTVPINDND